MVIDSRHFNTEFRNVYRKANEIETAVLVGLNVNPQDFIPFSDIKKHGTRVFEKDRKPIFVTCGARGIVSIDASGITEIPGIQLLKKLDTVDAGDTTISALALCLASGTDIEDVIHEAEILGYADLFEGGIQGSVGDINKYSKKLVIEKIIKENKLTGNELVVFGDGPIEIKECLKSNGIAIGIASDEVRRYGLNQEKRSRLIRSGAQILIPDFSQTNRLLKLLFNL